MGMGIEVYNADGSLQFNLGNRVYRLLTISLIGTTTSGSITNAQLATGTPIVGTIFSDPTRVAPTVTTSGSTVSWNYGSTPVGSRDPGLRISVGVF